MADCTYCGCAVEAHDPVFVYEERGREQPEDEERSGERRKFEHRDGEQREGEPRGDEREPAGQFCNYACLSAHIEETDLADGATCRLDV